MPNPLKELRSALKVLGDCPHCGLTRFVMANSWRGHGTGQHGSAQYEATSFEKVSPKMHCICIGGPVWQQIKDTEFGREARMSQALKVWRAQPEGERAKAADLEIPEVNRERMTKAELKEVYLELNKKAPKAKK